MNNLLGMLFFTFLNISIILLILILLFGDDLLKKGNIKYLILICLELKAIVRIFLKRYLIFF